MMDGGPQTCARLNSETLRKMAAPKCRLGGLIINPPVTPLTHGVTNHIRRQITSVGRANGCEHARCNRTGDADSA